MAAVNAVMRRRPRIFRERKDFQDLQDDEIVRRYRLSREAILDLVERLRGRLARHTNRSCPIPVLTKVLFCLRFLAKGDFLSEVADLHGVSRSSACHIITDVVSAINAVLDNIRFPAGRELFTIKQAFYQKCGIPNVIGAIDGTLVPIIAPATNPAVFICRKGYPAMNIQAVVDDKARFIDVVARWPGSTHDASILENCGLKDFLEEEHIGHLLGDAGYPLKRYLLTPIMRPATQEEIRYNFAHSSGRMVVERAFGLTKSRFRCLHKTGGCLMMKPEKVCQIAIACCRLHNHCIEFNVPNIEDHLADVDQPDNYQALDLPDVGAIANRHAIVRLFQQ